MNLKNCESDNKILILIPAYNEMGNFDKVVDNIIENYPEYDYIVINDASKDETVDVCKKKNYNYLDQCINLGIGGTVQNGYQYALENEYDIAVQVDGDGQHDVAYIKDMVRCIENEKADIVIGSRFIDKKGYRPPFARRVGIRLLSMEIFLLTWRRVKDVTSGFRAVNRRFMKIYAKEYPQDYPETEAIVSAIMHRGKIAETPVVMKERISGASSIGFWKSVYYMIKVTIALVICRIGFGIRRGK